MSTRIKRIGRAKEEYSLILVPIFTVLKLLGCKDAEKERFRALYHSRSTIWCLAKGYSSCRFAKLIKILLERRIFLGMPGNLLFTTVI